MANRFHRYAWSSAWAPHDSDGLLVLLVSPPEETPSLDNDAPPPQLEALANGLRQVTVFNAAIEKGALQCHWCRTPFVPDMLLSSTWVLEQLREATFADRGDALVLVDGHRLPLATLGSFLIVVLHPEPSFLAKHGIGLGPLPYFIAVQSTTEELPHRIDTLWVARSLGKILGLGEESSHPALLAAPDFWGRAFPNLFWDDQSWVGQGSHPPVPWWDRHPTASRGGFGSSAWDDFSTTGPAIWRPTDKCIMGSRSESGTGDSDEVGTDDFCPVCFDHLSAVLLNDPIPVPKENAATNETPSPSPPWDAATLEPDVLGRATTSFGSPPTSITLWDSIEPRKLVDHRPVPLPEGHEPLVSEDGRRVTIRYPEDGLILSATLTDQPSSLGKTLVLMLEASLFGEAATQVDASIPQDAPFSDEDPQMEAEVTVSEVPSAKFRFQIVNPVFAQGAPNFVPQVIYESDPGADDYDHELLTMWSGRLGRLGVNQFLLKASDWIAYPAGSPPPPDRETRGFVSSERPALGTGSYVGRFGLQFVNDFDDAAGIYPRRLQGEAAPALLLHLHTSLKTDVPSVPMAFWHTRFYAYIQCLGASDRWPRRMRVVEGAGVWRWFPRDADASPLNIGGVVYDGDDPMQVSIQWSHPGLPETLNRLHRILAPTLTLADWTVDTSTPEPFGLRDTVWQALAVDRPVQDDANSLKEAVTSLHAFASLAVGQLVFGLDGTLVNLWMLSSAIEDTLKHYAVQNRMSELMQHYPGDFSDDFFAIHTDNSLGTIGKRLPSWPQYIARVRALLEEHASLALTLGTRHHLASWDVGAIQKRVRTLTRDELLELRGIGRPEYIHDTVLAGLDSEQKYVVCQLIANLASMHAEQSGFETLDEGAYTLWETACVEYADNITLGSHLPILTVLAETLPKWRSRLANTLFALTDPVNPSLFITTSARQVLQLASHEDTEEIVLAAIVNEAFRFQIDDAEYPLALRIAQAGSALVRARRTHLAMWETYQTETTGADQTDIASKVAQARGECELAVHPYLSPELEQKIRAVTQWDHRRAEILATLGYDPADYVWLSLQAVQDHSDILTKFLSLLHVHPVLTWTLVKDLGDPSLPPSTLELHFQNAGLPAHFLGLLQAHARVANEATIGGEEAEIAAHHVWTAVHTGDTVSGNWTIGQLDEALATAFTSLVDLSPFDRAQVEGLDAYTNSLTSWAILGTGHRDFIQKLFGPTAADCANADANPVLENLLSSQPDELCIAKIALDYSVADFYVHKRIFYPQLYAAVIAFIVERLPQQAVGEVAAADGRLQMRSALALTRDPSVVSLSNAENVRAFHDQVVATITSSRRGLASDGTDSERIRDALYGAVIEGVSNSDSPVVRRMEQLYLEARVEQASEVRGWGGMLTVDLVDNAGPEYDEALRRLQLHLDRLAAGTIADDKRSHAITGQLSSNVWLSAQEYVGARSEFADTASMLAGMAAGIAISVALGAVAPPLAAPFLYASMASAMGGAAAAVATRFVIEGPDYVTAQEFGRDAVIAAGEGLIEAGVGRAIHLRKLAQLKKLQSAATARAIAEKTAIRLGGTAAGEAPTVAKIAEEAYEGAAEGLVAGLLSSGAQTALDYETWDRATSATGWRITTEALRGGAHGLVLGTVIGGGMGTYLHAMGGDEQLAGMFASWIIRRNKADWLNEITDWEGRKTLARAMRLAEFGDPLGARAELDGWSHPSISKADLIAEIVLPVENQAALRQVIQEFPSAMELAERKLGKHQDIFDRLTFTFTTDPTQRKSPRSDGGAEIHPVYIDGKLAEFRVVVDGTDPDILGIARREFWMYIGARCVDGTSGEPNISGKIELLQVSRLGDPTNYPTKPEPERVHNRQAYLIAETWVSERIIETFDQAQSLDGSQAESLRQAKVLRDAFQEELDDITLHNQGDPDAISRVDLETLPLLTTTGPNEVTRLEVLGGAVDFKKKFLNGDPVGEPPVGVDLLLPGAAPQLVEAFGQQATFAHAKGIVSFRPSPSDPPIVLFDETTPLLRRGATRLQLAVRSARLAGVPHADINLEVDGSGRLTWNTRVLQPYFDALTDPTTRIARWRHLLLTKETELSTHAETQVAINILDAIAEKLMGSPHNIPFADLPAALQKLEGKITVGLTTQSCQQCIRGGIERLDPAFVDTSQRLNGALPELTRVAGGLDVFVWVTGFGDKTSRSGFPFKRKSTAGVPAWIKIVVENSGTIFDGGPPPPLKEHPDAVPGDSSLDFVKEVHYFPDRGYRLRGGKLMRPSIWTNR